MNSSPQSSPKPSASNALVLFKKTDLATVLFSASAQPHRYLRWIREQTQIFQEADTTNFVEKKLKYLGDFHTNPTAVDVRLLRSMSVWANDLASAFNTGPDDKDISRIV